MNEYARRKADVCSETENTTGDFGGYKDEQCSSTGAESYIERTARLFFV
jgi:hypothetical protein